MSRTRRNFSAKFKSELVIELLKGGYTFCLYPDVFFALDIKRQFLLR